MSRRGNRRGRPYQPLPPRASNWAARMVIVIIAFVMIVGIAILAFAR